MDATTPNASLSESLSNQPSRNQSFSSQKSDTSHTAADQLQLEADAREALPYKFENCTKAIGKLRQVLFSCLTCNPPPTDITEPYNPAGVCYSCSIQCHGEHTLVELFNKRDFVCDCGTTRLPAASPCTLRLSPETNTKGGVHSEEPAADNNYNQNFRNRFCGCECDYDAYKEKGTMFQCLGLGTVATGGCGEDWWHPGCIVGIGADWYENSSQKGTSTKKKNEGLLSTITEVAEAVVDERTGETTEPEAMDEGEPEDGSSTKNKNESLLSSVPEVAEAVVDERNGETTEAEAMDDDGSSKNKNESLLSSMPEVAGAVVDERNGETAEPEPTNDEEPEDDETPLPPGFPDEDDFEGFICYKCVDANPWIKRYAGIKGFLAPVFCRSAAPSPELGILGTTAEIVSGAVSDVINPIKRKFEDDENSMNSGPAKRSKDDVSKTDALSTLTETKPALDPTTGIAADGSKPCKIASFPPAPTGRMSLFFKSDFREHLCRCADCFPLLVPHPQLLEEEENYEPSISESEAEAGGSTQGSGSIYDRGESALKNVDRVRAIEGVMAYNHLKEKLKPFFAQFAESGQAISAEDIKAHFAKMRGDEGDIKKAGDDAKMDGAGGDGRREQGGY